MGCVVGGLRCRCPVPGHARPGRDQLADDDVLLQPEQGVGAGLDGRLGEHPGGLLERRRRQPRVGGQRGLGDAHELGPALGRRLALLHQLAVDVGEHLLVDPLAGQEAGVAGLLDTATRRVICRTISSMCLSWIDTPWSRYTFCTSSTRYCWVSRTPLISSSSLGRGGPRRAASPAVTSSPSVTSRRAASGMRVARPRSPSSATIVTVRPCPRPRPPGRRRRCGPAWPCPWGCGPRTARPRGADRRRCREPAMPPVWNVRMVSCVPGSPMDWAAMTPTASPTSMSLPVASERP